MRINLCGRGPSGLLRTQRFKRAGDGAVDDPAVARLRECLEIDPIDELRHVLELMRDELGEVLRCDGNLNIDEQYAGWIAARG